VPAVKAYLPFVVVGLTSGSLYGLAGMGLVLTFKTSGIFNFAHGAMAAAAAFVFFDLHFMHGLPWPLALALCVFVLGPLMGLATGALARRLAGAPPVLTIVATVGLLLALQGLLAWKYGGEIRNVPVFLPKGSVRLFDTPVQYAQLVVVATGAIITGLLYVFFRRGRLGIAMRSVVDDPALLDLAGTPPERVRRAAWIIGSSFAALSGILIAPSLGLDTILLTLLVVQAFGAAAIGAFTSLPLTYAGGIGLGVAASVATKQVASHPQLSGLPATLPFLVLVVALLVIPRRRLLLPSAGAAAVRAADPWSVPAPVRRAGLAVGLVAAVAVPGVVGARLPVFINGAIFVLIFVSLGLLVWTSGQISLCHAAFAALGATMFSHFTIGLGLPWFVALIAAGVATVPLGAVVAVPAIRLSGIYLALATFGFGIVMERVVYGTGFMFGGTGLRAAPRPAFPGVDPHSDTAFYYVVLGVAVAGCGLVVAVSRSRLGRILRALRDSPVALTTHGVNVNATRLIVFCVSAFLAGVAGSLFVAFTGQAGTAGFGPFQSLIWLAVLAISGRSLVASAAVAALLLAVLPAYAPDGFTTYQTMLFGALAIVVPVLGTIRIRLGGERVRSRQRGGPVTSRMAAAGPVRPAVDSSLPVAAGV
jgi:branched-subunit amino acid ABC-type transport system permease component